MPFNADVFLLAAGLGKRLKPITDTLPKPLVKVYGKTLIERNLELIASFGVKRVIINLHYLSSILRDFLGDGSKWGLELVLVEESELLDTGGGIKNIEPFLRHENLVCINSDIILGLDFSLTNLLSFHQDNKPNPLITLCVRPLSKEENYCRIGVDKYSRVVAFDKEVYFGETKFFDAMFMGIQVINCSVIKNMPPRGEVFSITWDTMRNLLRSGAMISAFLYEGYFNDVGTIERLRKSEQDAPFIFTVS